MNAAVSLYKNNSLQAIANELTLNPIKVRKLLITAGVYESDIAEMVRRTFYRYRKIQNYKEAILSTASELKLSKASVTSYLPYEKGVYNKVSYRTKIHCFLHHLLKSCPVKFQQKRHQRSASGQSKRPRRQLRAPDAPNYVFHENRLSNMRKCRPDVKLTETLQMTLKRDIIVVRTSRFWYDNGML